MNNLAGVVKARWKEQFPQHLHPLLFHPALPPLTPPGLSRVLSYLHLEQHGGGSAAIVPVHQEPHRAGWGALLQALLPHFRMWGPNGVGQVETTAPLGPPMAHRLNQAMPSLQPGHTGGLTLQLLTGQGQQQELVELPKPRALPSIYSLEQPPLCRTPLRAPHSLPVL